MSAILHELIWNQETIALFSGMDPRTGQAKNNYQSSHMRIRTTLKVCSILVFLEIDNSDRRIRTVMNKTRKRVENNNGRTFKPPKQRRSTTIWNTSNALCNQNLLLAWHRGCHAVLIGCVSWRTRRPYKCLCLQCRLYPLGERRFTVQTIIDNDQRWGQITTIKFINRDATHTGMEWICFGTGRGQFLLYHRSRKSVSR